MTKSGGIFRNNVMMAYLVLAIVTLFSFWPALFAGFLNWDDPSIFVNNPQVFSANASNWWQLFFQTDSHNQTYIPLTILSFVLEKKLFGVVPFVAHFINLLLHVICAWLVLALALRMGLSRFAAFLTALMFAIHPLRVESVAWVTERKDVLFGVFYLGALVAYWDYLKGDRQGKYLIAFVCAVASVLAKPMALSLPLVLFLIDERAGRRWTMDALLDKLPFALALWPIAGVTFLMNSHHLPLIWPDSYGILVWSATFYVAKFFWPFDLSVFYPSPGTAQFLEGVILLIAIGLVTWVFRKDRWWRFGLLFYILTMFFIWRVDFIDGPRGLVHDRFMYIPCLGFTLCLGAWLDRGLADARCTRWFKIGWVGIVLILACQAEGTFSRCFVWQSSWTYWQEVLDQAPDNYFARINRAAYLVEGDAQKSFGWSRRFCLEFARRDLERAIKVAPKDPDVWQNYGIVLTKLGDDVKADEALKMATQLAPEKASIYNDWGNYYFRKKDWQSALQNYDIALKLWPSYPEALFNRSLLFEWMRKNLPDNSTAIASDKVR